MRKRSAYRPRPVAANPIAVAMCGAATLRDEDVRRQKAILEEAFAAYRRGIDCAHHWVNMADALNIAESLAAEGIGSDDSSRDMIQAGQRALAEAHQRHASTGSWTLTGPQISALDDALWLHGVQLDNCAHGEFERAYLRTVERIRQARAGNAPRGAVVLEGLIGETRAC